MENGATLPNPKSAQRREWDMVSGLDFSQLYQAVADVLRSLLDRLPPLVPAYGDHVQFPALG